MKTFLKILSICLVSMQAFAGPGSSGGGHPGPFNTCQDVSGDILMGEYTSGVKYGYGVGDRIVIKPGLIVQISLDKLPIGSPPIQFVIKGWSDRYGRIRGVAKFDNGRCQAEFTLVKSICRDKKQRMRLELPFWLSEFLFEPQVYNSDCRKAFEAHKTLNYAPASRDFF